MQSGEFQGCRVERQHPGIALITFNQPETLNALTHGAKRDLIETIAQAQMDDGTRVLVFTGEKRAPRFNQWLEGR